MPGVFVGSSGRERAYRPGCRGAADDTSRVVHAGSSAGSVPASARAGAAEFTALPLHGLGTSARAGPVVPAVPVERIVAFVARPKPLAADGILQQRVEHAQLVGGRLKRRQQTAR